MYGLLYGYCYRFWVWWINFNSLIKAMSKYIIDFEQIGESTVNVDLICKDWNERFVIRTWINDNEERYTFIIKGKRKNTTLCKTQISKKQAMEVVDKLDLIHVKDGISKSRGNYHSIKFIKSEVERMTKMKQNMEQDLSFISQALYMYERCL